MLVPLSTLKSAISFLQSSVMVLPAAKARGEHAEPCLSGHIIRAKAEAKAEAKPTSTTLGYSSSKLLQAVA